MTLTALLTNPIAVGIFLYQLKHFICDFVLQNQYMLQKFNREKWAIPLAAHCTEHAIGTILVLCGFVIGYSSLTFSLGTSLLILGLATFDFIVHFTMDRIKAHPDLGASHSPYENAFWKYVGVDQMVHHLTHYIIIILFIGFV